MSWTVYEGKMNVPQKQDTGEYAAVRNIDTRAVIIFLAIGLLAGFLASLIVGGSGGLIRYLITGVIGAFVGGFLFSFFNISLGIKQPLVNQIVTSTIGAIVVVLLARLIA
jgi:uncharacterized membrane protein YeaQ/YmgE (transglycosylase-associated protein family)